MYSPELKEVEAAFFEGMQHGWAAGNEGEQLVGHPGFKHILYTTADGKYNILDCWGNDLTTQQSAAGSILITTRDNIPMWVMRYRGKAYEERIIPFLRQTLHDAHSKHFFCGGRGLSNKSDEGLSYINMFEGDFRHFEGEESILNQKHLQVGWHRYWGGSLMYLA